MFCTKCGASITDSNNFCGQCGENVRVVGNQTNTSVTGDNGFSAGQNNVFTGNYISLAGKSNKPIVIVDRISAKPLRLMGKHLKAAWLMITGFVGLIANFATILTSFTPPNNFIYYILMAVSFIIFAIGVVLKQYRFLPLFFQRNVEADKSGYIYITQLSADCPVCDGELKIKNLGPKENRKTYLRCTRNPDHLFLFDPTILDDPHG
ncbi:TPA: zinc-ribbon domain-containing protein [Salmonella enterica]